MSVDLQKVNSQFSLKTITHLYQCMIWFVSEKFDSNNVPIYREQVEQLIFVYSLQKKVRVRCAFMHHKSIWHVSVRGMQKKSGRNLHQDSDQIQELCTDHLCHLYQAADPLQRLQQSLQHCPTTIQATRKDLA